MSDKNMAFGVDIGGHSLKCVLLDVKEGLIRKLWKAEILPERQSIEQGLNWTDLTDHLSSLLKTCQQECHSYGYKIHTAIQGAGTVVKYIELPPFVKDLSEAEERNALLSQASKYVPFPFEQMTLSYFKVPPIDSDEKKSAYFFVAAQKELVERQMKMFTGLGLHVERLEVPAIGLVRELNRNHDLTKGRFWGLVHVGFKTSELIVLRGEYPYYVKEFSLAARDFTYVFQMNAQSSWKEAERSKLEYDTLECKPFIEPFINRWLNEVKEGLNAFSKQFNGAPQPIEKIFLSGGTASWKNFHKRLSEHLQIPVTLDGWDRLKCEKNDTGDGQPWVYKVAVGLAI